MNPENTRRQKSSVKLLQAGATRIAQMLCSFGLSLCIWKVALKQPQSLSTQNQAGCGSEGVCKSGKVKMALGHFKL